MAENLNSTVQMPPDRAETTETLAAEGVQWCPECQLFVVAVDHHHLVAGPLGRVEYEQVELEPVRVLWGQGGADSGSPPSSNKPGTAPEHVGEKPSGKVAANTAAAPIIALIQDQLAHERDVKASLESRAATVVGSSTGLVTLLFTIIGFLASTHGLSLSVVARYGVGFAMAGLGTAAVLGIFAARPQSYVVVGVGFLRRNVDEAAFATSEQVGDIRAARKATAVLRGARRGNAEKARWLIAAAWAEVAAIVALGVAIIATLV